ncbi:MAG: hypothetical protein MAG431_01080 [Chloroflexi bacterium]|nr:hypothetical protein [Chloroflexota bacterium]
MDLMNIARLLAILGVIILLAAAIFYAFARLDLPFGRLPGDMRIERENFTCIFPLATSLILSVILTILLNLLVKLFRR